ncbi:MAG: GGDEF domain-containing protein [Candidatus Brocadiia bacterium]
MVTGVQETSSETLLERVLASDSLPSVPVVAANVLTLSRDPDVDFSRLEKMMSADPALVAKLLRMSNSAYFGSRKKVTSINEAVVRIGLKITRMTVLSFSLEAEISPKVPESFEIDQFWRHALTTAIGARILAERIWPAKRDDAFAAGILQDLGMLALQCAVPDRYAKVFESRRAHPTTRIEEVEQRVLGFTHARVGSELLRTWGIPEEVYGPIRFHHDPDSGTAQGASPDSIRLARVLLLCSKISHLFYSKDRGIIHITIAGEAREQFNLMPEALDGILQQVTRDVRQFCDLFNLDPRQIPSYEEVRLKAERELTSLAAEPGGPAPAPEERSEEHAAEVRQMKAEAEALKRPAGDEPAELPSRRDFLKRFVGEIARARRYAHSLGFLVLDIDHFKQVNDTYGHPAGDKVLAGISRFLQKEIRCADIAARLGGEEFVVCLPETDLKGVIVVAEKFRLGIAEASKSWAPGLPGITVSVGAVHARFDSPSLDGSLMIDEADRCLYQAKVSGRNCTRYASI